MNEKLKQLLVRLIRHLDLEKRSALIAVNGVGVVLAGNVNATGATILEAMTGDKKEVSADVCSLFMLADMFESVSMDLESMTKPIVVGSYNPFAQLELRAMIQRLRTLLSCVYKDSPEAYADEFANAADRMLPLVTNNARSAFKRAGQKEVAI